MWQPCLKGATRTSSERPVSSVGLEEFCFVSFASFASWAGGRAGPGLPMLGSRSGEQRPLPAPRVDVLVLSDDVLPRFHSQLSRGELCELRGLKFHFALRGNHFFLVTKPALLPAPSLCL